MVVARKTRRGTDVNEDESSVGSPVPDGRGRKGKGKGRAKKENDYDSGPSNGKRKRSGGKSMSVTPSYLDDDDDGRDAVSVSLSSCYVEKPLSVWDVVETTENERRRHPKSASKNERSLYYLYAGRHGMRGRGWSQTL